MGGKNDGQMERIASHSPDLSELNSSGVYSLLTTWWGAGKTLLWWANPGGP